MKVLIYLSIEVMGWLTILAALTCFFPATGGIVWDNSLPPVAEVPMRTIQLTPCFSWATTRRWNGAYVCVWTNQGKAAWQHQVKEG